MSYFVFLTFLKSSGFISVMVLQLVILKYHQHYGVKNVIAAHNLSKDN